MAKATPDHHDAELVIKLYDLRREAVMRQARSAINAWIPRTWEELVAVTQPTHPLNSAWRQTSSYWEMVYSMARHGIVSADFFAENNAEGLILFAKVAPYLERFRKEFSPTAFTNAEWISKECASGRQRFELFTKRVKQMQEAQAKA
jgi:hypothetical protein